MFQVRGQFDVKMDAKGRVGLPARLRERIEAAEAPASSSTEELARAVEANLLQQENGEEEGY